MNSKKVDLHLHSNRSDGAYSPSELVAKLAASGLSAFALTDHDTIGGLDEAAEAAVKCGIDFVPGIEISVVEETREIHILGYYPVKLQLLEDNLVELRNQRFLRMERTVRLLQKSGFDITESEVLAEAGQAAPGRMHLANVLLRKNYVRSVDEAFKHYLGFNKLAYVQRKTLNLPETIRLLVDCQAVPVFAHPGSEGLKIIKSMVPLGLMGVEAFHPDHSNKVVRHALLLAAEQGLLITGGSDYHGSSEMLSPYPIEKAIDYSYLKQLKARIGLKGTS